MNPNDLTALAQLPLQVGRVLEMTESGRIRVAPDADPEAELTCEVLVSANDPPVLEPGDPVILWVRTPGHAVVLGRIADRLPVRSPTAPDSLVLEARENLTLRCGDGSITIRKDGKILIKGKDLVSHAQRANRIRGGSVAIN